MISDLDFWKNIIDAWISVQTIEEKDHTLLFAERLAEKQINSNTEKVKSIYEELFGEED